MLGLLGLAHLPASASTISWTNTSGGNWNSPANWSPNQVPAGTDTAVITAPGNYAVSLNSSPTIAGLTLGAASGATTQTLFTAGQSLTVNGAIQLSPQGQFMLNGGGLAGKSVFTGKLTWTGGSLSGQLTLATNSALNILTGGGNGFNGLILTNFGTVTWTNTTLFGLNGTNVQIFNYGTWNALSDNTFAGGYNNAITTFNNFGTFLKSGGTGVTTLDGTVVFNNSGLVEVDKGTLNLNGGGTNNGGNLVTLPGAALNFYASVFTNLSSFTGSGSSVAGGATFSGAISGILNWTGGSLAGTLTLANDGTLNILPGGGNGFNGLYLTNYGVINWSNAPLHGVNNANARIYNYGLFNDLADDTFSGGFNNGTSTFANFGTFRKAGGAGTTTFDANVTFTNAGTLDAQTGTIQLAGPYVLTGGRLNFGINSAANYGQISLAGTPGLTGTLAANLNNGFVPAVGNSFQVLKFTNFTGFFLNTNLPSSSIWRTAYTATNVTLSVLKIVPAISWAVPADIVYGTLLSDNQLNATAASPTSPGTALPGTFTYGSPLGTALRAGSNQLLTVLFTPLDTVNFTNARASVPINVQRAPLTVTAKNQTKTYGQNITLPSTEVTSVGLLFDDALVSATLTSPGTVSSALVAHSPYVIVPGGALGSGLTNYAINYVSGLLTVAPATLLINPNARFKNYGESVVFVGNEFTPYGLVNGDVVTNVTLACSGTTNIATVAGSPYPITCQAALGSGLDNYKITYNTGTLNVGKISLRINAKPRTKTYGQAATFAGTEFTSTGLLNSDTITNVSLSSTGAVATALVANSPFSIVPTNALGTGLTNYNISYVNGSLSVATAPLSVTATNQSKIYGQTLTFAGTEITTSGLLNGDTVTGATLASTGAGPTARLVGSPFPITLGSAVGTGLANYKITYVPGGLTVTPASLTITAADRSKSYGQAVTFAGTEFIPTGLLNSDNVTRVTLASPGAPASAPTTNNPYPISATAALGSGLDNYAISYLSGSLTVNRALLSVNARKLAKTYGQSLVLSGTEYDAVGLANSDTVTNVNLACAGLPGNSPLSKSPYSITISNALGIGLTNYSVGYNAGQLTVNPAPLTITALNSNKVYGQTITFAGTEFAATALQNGETLSRVALASGGAAPTATVTGSPYPIVPSAVTGGTLDPANYAITYAPGALAVSRANLIVTANNASRNYGAADPAYSAAFTGLANGETPAVVSGSAAFSTPALVTSGVGIYPLLLSVGSLSSPNYTFTSFVSGTLTINPAPLTIIAADTTKTYGQSVTFAGTEFTTLGLVNGDTVTHASLSSAGAPPSAGVGGSPYAIAVSAATGTGLGNYSLQYQSGRLTVAPAPLSISTISTNKFVGETITFTGQEFSVTGLQNGESLGSLGIASAGGISNAPVGSYPVVPGVPSGGTYLPANYATTNVNGTLTVAGPPVLTFATDGTNSWFSFPTLLNRNYHLQYHGNVGQAPWNSLGGTVIGTGTPLSVTNTIPAPAFFRLQIDPL